MATPTPVPITPEVLAWAIRESGYGTDEVADRVRVVPQVLLSWLTGEARPGLTQFRRLATVLRRQEATFLLPAPPATNLPRVEFRHPLDSDRRSLSPEELRWLREARRIQQAAAWIGRELQRPAPPMPRWGVHEDPEAAGVAMRSHLALPIEEQLAWKDPSQALRAWRTSLEAAGVLVFLLPLGSRSCRGFSLWDEGAPLIAVNTAWNLEARIFTLLHEYGHLVTRTSSACVDSWRQALPRGGDAEERWCERFAAAVLMPWPDVERVLRTELGWRSGQTIDDFALVRKLARRFRTSLRATTLRLVSHGIAEWPLYQRIPAFVDDKRPGGGGSGRVRSTVRLDQYGRRATELFMEALRHDVLSRADVLSYLDVPDSDLP